MSARIPRICFFGPESTGKTTLSQALGAHFGCPVIPEYGRTYTERYTPTTWVNADFLKIAWGHVALRHEVEKDQPSLIVEDTDPVATAIWSYKLGVPRDPWFASYDEPADLYFLTHIDLSWIDDGLRYWPDQAQRRAFFDACQQELEQRKLPYHILDRSWEHRKAQAIATTQTFLARSRQGLDSNPMI